MWWIASGSSAGKPLHANTSTLPLGVLKAVIKDRSTSTTPGRVVFTVKAKSSRYAPLASGTPLSATLVLHPPFGQGAGCGDIQFLGPDSAPVCTPPDPDTMRCR